MALFAVAVPGRAAADYQTVEVASLRIEIDSDWAVRAAPGYLPVRFAIVNLGEARVIEIVCQGGRYFKGSRHMPGGMHVVQTVKLSRGDRVRLTIPVPIYGDNESIQFSVRENGRPLEHFNYQGFQARTAAADASALIVVDPATDFGAAAARWPRPITSAGSSSTFTIAPVRPGVSPSGAGVPALDFLLAPARLPANWLGYTSLRAVFIRQAEWEQLKTEQRDALLAWTACGGDLFFLDGEPGALFPGEPHPAADAGGGTARNYFFGRVHRMTAASVAEAGLLRVLTEAQKVQDGNWALPANSARDWGVIAAQGFRLPIPGFGDVRARSYVTILLLFSLVIGPVNYWFLRRIRQPVLLVLTAPLISGIFVVLLAGYVVAGEGFAVRGRAVTVTMLDQARGQASTRGSASLYAAGMAPSAGLRFPRNAAVFPIGVDGTGSRVHQFLNLTDAQHFPSGLMATRSPTNIEQIDFRTARERLRFERDAGGTTVVNGLGAAVTALFYREGGTTYTLRGPLPAGGKATVTAASPRAFAAVLPQGLPMTKKITTLFENQPAGSYLAVLERSPFWDAGVEGVIEHGSFHVVIGWPEGQP